MSDTANRTATAQRALAEEFKKMQAEYEPLLPVEKKLIGYTFATGILLLILLIVISRAFL